MEPKRLCNELLRRLNEKTLRIPLRERERERTIFVLEPPLTDVFNFENKTFSWLHG